MKGRLLFLYPFDQAGRPALPEALVTGTPSSARTGTSFQKRSLSSARTGNPNCGHGGRTSFDKPAQRGTFDTSWGPHTGVSEGDLCTVISTIGRRAVCGSIVAAEGPPLVRGSHTYDNSWCRQIILIIALVTVVYCCPINKLSNAHARV